MKQMPPSRSSALTIGVTGHRPNRDPTPGDAFASRSPKLREDKVRKGIDAFLDLLEDARVDLGGTAPATVVMVSALAEGSDRIAAKAALDRGMPLDALLPCPREFYEQTFSNDASRAEFASLIARTRTRAILPFPARTRAPSQPDLARAYEAAGLSLLARADILLAVWDGQSARGRGGTGDIVEAAARRGAPIVVVDPADGSSRLLRVGGSSGPRPLRARELPAAELDRGALAELVRAIVLLRRSDDQRAGPQSSRQPGP